jgi:hypothetical protein
MAYDYGPSNTAIQKVRIIQRSATQYDFYLLSGWYNAGTILTVTGFGFEFSGTDLNTTVAPTPSAGQYMLNVGAYRIYSTRNLTIGTVSGIISTSSVGDSGTYANDDQTNLSLYTTSQIDTLFTNYYNKSDIDTNLATYAKSSNVYSTSAIDSMLTNYYTQTQIDTNLSTYAKTSNVYLKSAIDTMLTSYATVSSLSSYLTTATAASTYATISSLSSYITSSSLTSTLSSYLTTSNSSINICDYIIII